MLCHLAITLAALAADGPAVRVESVGGSRLVGTLKARSIVIKADFGTVEVDPSKIRSASFSEEGDTIVTTSGSTIKGKIAAESFEIDSEFGVLKIDRSKLRSLSLGEAAREDRKDEPRRGPLELKPDPKADATDSDRPARPSPIPRFLTQPTSARVTKIGVERHPPARLNPPSYIAPPSSSTKRRVMEP